MLFGGTLEVFAAPESGWLRFCGKSKTAATIVSVTKAATSANRLTIFQRSRIWTLHSCNFVFSSRIPRRAAGAMASIDTNRDRHLLVTRVAVSNSLGIAREHGLAAPC